MIGKEVLIHYVVEQTSDDIFKSVDINVFLTLRIITKYVNLNSFKIKTSDRLQFSFKLSFLKL